MPALGAGALVAAGTAALVMAADAEVAMKKFAKAFEGSTEEASAGVEELNRVYGIAETSAVSAMSFTGDLLKGFGATGAEALKTSLEVQKLAAALSASDGIPFQEASDRITKALVGETDGYIIEVCNCTKFYPVSTAYNCRTQTQLTGLDLQISADTCTSPFETACEDPGWTPTVGANVWYKVFWVGGGPPIPSGSQPNAWYSYSDELAVKVDSTTFSYTTQGTNGYLKLRNSASYSTAAAACAGCVQCPDDC